MRAEDCCYRRWAPGQSDKLPPSFHLKASFDHLERPHAQCAFTTAQVELYHLSRLMTCDQFLQEKDILEQMAGRRAALLAWLIWEEGNWRSDFGARAKCFLAAVSRPLSAGGSRGPATGVPPLADDEFNPHGKRLRAVAAVKHSLEYVQMQLTSSTGELEDEDRPATPDPAASSVSKRGWELQVQQWRNAITRVLDAAPVDAATLAAVGRLGAWTGASPPDFPGIRVLAQDGNCIVRSYAIVSGDFRGAIDYCNRFPVRPGSKRFYVDVAAHFGLSLGVAGLEAARLGRRAPRPGLYLFHVGGHCRPVAVPPEGDDAYVWRGYSRFFIGVATLVRKVEEIGAQLLFIDGGWRFPLCAGLRAGGDSGAEGAPSPVGDETEDGAGGGARRVIDARAGQASPVGLGER